MFFIFENRNVGNVKKGREKPFCFKQGQMESGTGCKNSSIIAYETFTFMIMSNNYEIFI